MPNLVFTLISSIQCPSYNPLSPPVDNYTVTVNNKDPVSVVSDGSCSYTTAIAVSPQDAPYSVSVVATNDVGDSDTTVMDNISKSLILFSYFNVLSIVSVQDVVTVIANSTFDTINFTFTGTVDDTTPVTITLSPNDGMGDGTIGDGVVISGLMSDTPYTYTVSFEYNNIMYSTQSSVTTLVAPTTLITTSSTTTSGIDKNAYFTTITIVQAIHSNTCLCVFHLNPPLVIGILKTLSIIGTTTSYATPSTSELCTALDASIVAGISVAVSVPITSIITAIVTSIITYLCCVKRKPSVPVPAGYEIPTTVDVQSNVAYGHVSAGKVASTAVYESVSTDL